jgi:hypothetical protein
MSWSTVIESEKVSNMLYFLSRTPDGEAVMPFLDVFTKEYEEIINLAKNGLVSFTPNDIYHPIYGKDHPIYDIYPNIKVSEKPFEETLITFSSENYGLLPYIKKDIPKTLDHLLHREFTEALRVGKTFDEAYKIINLIYLQNV